MVVRIAGRNLDAIIGADNGGVYHQIRPTVLAGVVRVIIHKATMRSATKSTESGYMIRQMVLVVIALGGAVTRMTGTAMKVGLDNLVMVL